MSTNRAVAALVTVLVVLAAFPAPAAAQGTVGTTVVVEEGERVNGFTVTADRVIIRGTVDGDLQAFASSVRIAESGEVTGRVRAMSGAVSVAGTVRGSLVAYSGRVTVEEPGTVRGGFGGAVGSASVRGTVGDDITVAAGSLTLTSTAVVNGDVTYNGGFSNEGADVQGDIRESADLELIPGLPPLFGPVFILYGMLTNLLLGALLLFFLPELSEGVVNQIVGEPLPTFGIGIATAVVVPLALLVLLVTIIGIPIALAGLVLFVVLLWLSGVYGRYALGELLLSRTEKDGRFLALLVGILVIGLLVRIPLLGDLIRVIVALFGLGALSLAIVNWYQSDRDPRF